MTHLYILSGLGADKRIFHRMDWNGYNVTYIEWLPPMNDESWELYALRLRVQIQTPDPILVGVSFGV